MADPMTREATIAELEWISTEIRTEYDTRHVSPRLDAVLAALRAAPPVPDTCVVCREQYPSTGQRTRSPWAAWGPGYAVCRRCRNAGQDAKAAPTADTGEATQHAETLRELANNFGSGNPTFNGFKAGHDSNRQRAYAACRAGAQALAGPADTGAPPCPACVSERGTPDPTCVTCHGSGRCPSAGAPPALVALPAKWIVVRYTDAIGCHAVEFDNAADAAEYHDRAQLQWSECFLTAVLRTGSRRHATPAAPTGEACKEFHRESDDRERAVPGGGTTR